VERREGILSGMVGSRKEVEAKEEAARAEAQKVAAHAAQKAASLLLAEFAHLKGKEIAATEERDKVKGEEEEVSSAEAELSDAVKRYTEAVTAHLAKSKEYRMRSGDEIDQEKHEEMLAARASIEAMKDFLGAQSKAAVLGRTMTLEEQAKLLAEMNSAKVLEDKMVERKADGDAKQAEAAKEQARDRLQFDENQMKKQENVAGADIFKMAALAAKALKALKTATTDRAKQIASLVAMMAQKSVSKSTLGGEAGSNKGADKNLASVSYDYVEAKESFERTQNLKEAPPYMAPYPPKMAASLGKAAGANGAANAGLSVRNAAQIAKHIALQLARKDANKAEKVRSAAESAEIKGGQAKEKAEADMAMAVSALKNACKAKTSMSEFKTLLNKSSWLLTLKRLLRDRSEAAADLHSDQASKAKNVGLDMAATIKLYAKQRDEFEAEAEAWRNKEKDRVLAAEMAKNKAVELGQDAEGEYGRYLHAKAALAKAKVRRDRERKLLERLRKAVRSLTSYIIAAHRMAADAKARAGVQSKLYSKLHVKEIENEEDAKATKARGDAILASAQGELKDAERLAERAVALGAVAATTRAQEGQLARQIRGDQREELALEHQDAGVQGTEQGMESVARQLAGSVARAKAEAEQMHDKAEEARQKARFLAQRAALVEKRVAALKAQRSMVLAGRDPGPLIDDGKDDPSPDDDDEEEEEGGGGEGGEEGKSPAAAPLGNSNSNANSKPKRDQEENKGKKFKKN
jgi:hypothetical protein